MMNLLRQLFINPQMLAGMAVISVPIIIYLINRQRYQRLRWAAMEFLLRAMKRHQRRIQLKNLLLLLVRIAVLALLVLALARPVLRKSAVAVLPDTNSNWVLAVDASYSMGWVDDTKSLFDRTRETIGRFSKVLLKPGDRVAVVALDRRPRLVLPPVHLGDEGRQKLLGEIAGLELTSGGLDLGASLGTIDEACGKFTTDLGDPEPKKVVVFSDFQRRDWIRSGGIPVPGAAAFIEKIQKEGGEFALAQLNESATRPNLVITELVASPALIARDVWVELRATVRSFADRDLDNIDLTIEVDTDPDDTTREPQLGDVVRIPAGGSVTRVLPFRFSSAGYHTVVAEVRSDGLLIDNRRFLTVDVAESIKVLLVDGDPSASPLDRETFHLEVALEPRSRAEGGGLGRVTPFEPEYITADQLAGRTLGDYATVVLANVGDLPIDQVQAVERYVKAGGALLVFLGANVRPEFYNKYLVDAGLLPGVLENVRGDPRYPVYLEAADATHPVSRYFEEHRDSTHLERPVIAFNRYYRVGGLDTDKPGTRVMFRFTDSLRSPAVFDNACGDGRVLWATSTADQEWNEFSSWPDFVVFLYESLAYLVRFGASTSNLRVGETFRRVYSSRQYAGEVLLRTPESSSEDLRRSRNVRLAMRELPGGNDFEVAYDDTREPGIYRLDLVRRGLSDADSVEYFAVNVDTSESDLRPMTDEDFQASFESLRYQTFDVSKRIRAIEGRQELLRGREFWKWVVFALLGLVAAETILAYVFGRREG